MDVAIGCNELPCSQENLGEGCELPLENGSVHNLDKDRADHHLEHLQVCLDVSHFSFLMSRLIVTMRADLSNLSFASEFLDDRCLAKNCCE